MCPSYRVTRDERDVTRGRANTLRLAITGQLGPDALTSEEMAETLLACVSCKAMPARMPDRRRHGAHEDRGAGRARRQIRPVAARPPGRLSAALRRLRQQGAVAAQPARPAAGRGEPVGVDCRLQRAPHPAALAVRCVPACSDAYAARLPASRWARSCCSPTPSTACSSARTSTPRSRCSAPPATTCMWRGRAGAGRGRCAAGARSSRSGSSTRRATRPSGSSPRSSPSSRAACRSSGSSRAASSASATRSRP